MSQIARKLVAGVVGVGMMALGMMVMSVVKAQAYSDALDSNNTAQITITITPNIDRAVTIDTGNVNMNLGTVELGAFVSTQTVNPSTVTIGGNFGNTDLLLSGQIDSAGTAWSFDADSATLETDGLATWVSFTSISSAIAPSQDSEYFNGTTAGSASDLLAEGSNQTAVASLRVGTDLATDNGRFENGGESMNNMVLDLKRHMWMFFRMPDATNEAAEQSITFILTVDAGL